LISLPAAAERKLAKPTYARLDVESVNAALRRLETAVPDSFRDFYTKYAGPFGSKRIGFLLLDLCEDTPNVITQTQVCRKEHGWPKKLVVLTDLLGNAVLVLDAEIDRVFNVDFEGGDEELIRGQLEPSWSSFNDFLSFFFG